MSLESRLTALAEAIGADVKSVGEELEAKADSSALGALATKDSVKNADIATDAAIAKSKLDKAARDSLDKADTAVQGNDSRLSNSREWTASTVSQAEAEAGTSTTRRAWTAQRVRRAIIGWWDGFGTAFGRGFVSLADAAAGRSKLGLGSAATRNVGTGSGQLMEVGAFGLGATPNDPTSATGTDFNQMTTGGLFSVNTGTLQNAPGSDSWGSLLVMPYWPGHLASQILLESATDRMYFRRNRSGTWRPWREVTHSGNLRTTTGTSTVYPMSQKAVTEAVQGVSDGRDKTNIQPTNIGLELIEKLNPVSYNLNKRDLYRTEEATTVELVEGEDGYEEEVTKVCSETLKKPLTDYDNNDGHLARTDKYTGLIAQDVKAAYESLGLDMCVVKNLSEEYGGGEDRYYIEYNGLIPVLINAVKELSARVKELEGE